MDEPPGGNLAMKFRIKFNVWSGKYATEHNFNIFQSGQFLRMYGTQVI